MSESETGGSERRYPIVGVCLRCGNEYFDLRRIMTLCTIDCGGYITGKTREELEEFRERNQDTDSSQTEENDE